MLKERLLTLIVFQIFKIGIECKILDLSTNHKINENQSAQFIHTYINSYGIQKLSACKVKLDNGDIIDLSTLDNENASRFFKISIIYILNGLYMLVCISYYTN